MDKKSKWVRFRNAIFNGLKTLFTKVIGLLRSDGELKKIFQLAGIEIIAGIKSFENDDNMSGSEKLMAVRDLVTDVLKQKGVTAGKYIINLAIEMTLNWIRNK